MSVQKDGRDEFPIPIPGGEVCPSCAKPMQRYTHDPTWKPLPGNGFMRYWDRCVPCRRISNPPEAYVLGKRR